MPNEPGARPRRRAVGEAPKVYWDACVFIHRIQGTSDKIALLDELTDLADKGALKIVTSAMTVAEVVKGPDEGVLPEDQAELIASYFEHDWIELIPVDRPIAEKAAALARDHSGLKPADSIHLATAIESKVIMLHTYDQRHLGKLSKKCGNPPLEIGAPKHPESLPLLDETSSHGEGGSDLKEDTSKAHHLDSDERDQRPGTEEAGAVVPAENEQPSQFDMA